MLYLSNIADGQSVLQEPLLKYRLPAVACPPPLVLQVTPVLPPETVTQKQSVLFVVQYCVNPKLSGSLRDVTVTLQLPKPLGQPTKVMHCIQSVHLYATTLAVHTANICPNMAADVLYDTLFECY